MTIGESNERLEKRLSHFVDNVVKYVNAEESKMTIGEAIEALKKATENDSSALTAREEENE